MSTCVFPPLPPDGRKSGEKRRLSDDSGSSLDSSSTVDSSRPVKRRPGITSNLSVTTNPTSSVGSSKSPRWNDETSPKSAPTNDQNVRVVTRIRPLSSKEQNEKSKEALTAVPGSGTVVVDKSRKFEFDAVFGPGTTQREVYERSAGDMLEENIFKGFNVTILAYGQTGSGKTFTMGTNGGDTADKPPPPPGQSNTVGVGRELTPPSDGDGIIPRAVYDLFKARAGMKHGDDRVEVEMSYLEIYNEEARDLLADSNDLLHIRDSKTEGVVVVGLSTHTVQSPADVTSLMETASQRRVVASTAMNAVSSRSHAICTLHITIKGPPSEDGGEEGSDEEIQSKLTLVDLAGSERIKRTGAEGARMKEGININKGLFVLGQVVSALSEAGQHQNGASSSGSSNHSHIPYRDSKLTRLLQDSLGGNSRTVMVACVSPADSNTEESINTLRYASRARNIKNSAVRNVVAMGMSQAEAAALRRENQLLKLQVLQLQMQLNSAAVSGRNTVAGTSTEKDENNELQGMNVSQLGVVTQLRAKCSSLERNVEHMEEQVSSAAEAALAASLKADKWQLRCEQLEAAAKEKGVDLLEGTDKEDESKGVVISMRNEIESLKAKLHEAQADAAIARATAAAVVAGDGDLTAAEKLALATDEAQPSESSAGESGDSDEGTDKNEQSEKLTSALVAMTGEIEQKEAMAVQMNKERECMEALQSHFQGALNRLQDEVEVLMSEKDMLIAKVEQSSRNTSTRRVDKSKAASMHSNDTPEHKKMRERITELEKRIKDLKQKAAEHKKSIRMKEQAEKKCAQLAAEIAQDKKRRAAMQRKLKEAAEERRIEKKAAQQHATRILRDSQKLRHELNKVKEAAQRQAQVLRRKAAEALRRQKSAAEMQKKRNNVSSMRAMAASSNTMKSQRKEELTVWLEREINLASTLKGIKEQIDEQTKKLNDAESKKEELLEKKGPSSEDSSTESVLRDLENEIDTRKGVIGQLKMNAAEVHRTVALDQSSKAQSSIFIDGATWHGLSRNEVRYIAAQFFEHLVCSKNELEGIQLEQDNKISAAVRHAVSEEKRKAEATITELKFQHSETMMTLLESTKGAMEQKVRMEVLKAGNGAGIDPSIQKSIDEMLGSFLTGCDRVGDSVKGELNEVRNHNEDMKNVVTQVAKSLIAQNEAAATLAASKKPKPKTTSKLPEDEEEFIFDDEEDDVSSDDSDWSPDSPTPKRRPGDKPKLVTEEASDREKLQGITLNEDKTQVENLDKLKVTELRDLLRQRGMAVSGKKADLLRRLKLQSSIVSTENEEKENVSTDDPPSALNEPKKKRRVTRRPLVAKPIETTDTNENETQTPSSKGKKSSVAFWSSSPRNTEASGSPKLKRTTRRPIRITQSAKKRRRRSMAVAVSTALVEVENALKN